MVIGQGEENDYGEKDDGKWLAYSVCIFYGFFFIAIIASIIFVLLKGK